MKISSKNYKIYSESVNFHFFLYLNSNPSNNQLLDLLKDFQIVSKKSEIENELHGKYFQNMAYCLQHFLWRKQIFVDFMFLFYEEDKKMFFRIMHKIQTRLKLRTDFRIPYVDQWLIDSKFNCFYHLNFHCSSLDLRSLHSEAI